MVESLAGDDSIILGIIITEEDIKRIEDKCVIKSKEQFFSECEKNGIPADWYSFTYEQNKPVSIEGSSVYYRKYGVTNCTVYMTVWDVAFKELMAYKEAYEWEQSDEILKVTNIGILRKFYIRSKEEYPVVLLSDMLGDEPSESKREELKKDGWNKPYYDHYDGNWFITKDEDIRNILTGIRIHFKKKTDNRDIEEFGFREKVTKGSYKYPIPADMLEEIAQEYHAVCTGLHYGEPTPLSEALKDKILKRLASNIIDDEFNALLELKDACNSGKKYYNNPAYYNALGCRSYLIEFNNPVNDGVRDINNKFRS